MEPIPAAIPARDRARIALGKKLIRQEYHRRFAIAAEDL